MESNCVLLKRQVEEMEVMLQNAMAEKEDMASQLVDTQDKLDGIIIFYPYPNFCGTIYFFQFNVPIVIISHFSRHE